MNIIKRNVIAKYVNTSIASIKGGERDEQKLGNRTKVLDRGDAGACWCSVLSSYAIQKVYDT